MNRWFLMIAALSLAVVIVGCSNNDVTSSSASDEHDHHTVASTPETETTTDENTEYILSGFVNEHNELFIETNLLLSKENYNGSHQEGEGHVHLFVNDNLIGPLQDKEPFLLANLLDDGENKIRLVLASNNHDESVYQTSYEFIVSN